MNDERNDDWTEQLTPREREAMAALPRERTPRPGLEDSIVAQLRRSGHIHGERSRGQRLSKIAIAAAAVLLLTAGAWWFGRSTASSPSPPHWILLLHDVPSTTIVAREESERRIQEYGQWARGARSHGLIDGEKLGDEGTWMHATGTDVESRPLASGEDTLGGYFLLGAMNESAARDLASTCPHLRYGGVIELRRVDI